LLKVKSSALTKVDDIVYLLGARYSGVAFYISDDGEIYDIINYSHGYANGIYQPPDEYNCTDFDIVIDENSMRVDVDMLQSGDSSSYTGEPFMFRGEAFTGVAYRFQGEFCIEEKLYLDGYYSSIEMGSEWYFTGVLKSLDLDYMGNSRCNFGERYGFYEDGMFSRGGFWLIEECNGSRVRTSGGWGFNENSQISGVGITGNYFDRYEEFSLLMKYPHLLPSSKCDMRKFRCASCLILNDDGIDDELVYNISSNHGLDNVKELLINDTSLSADLILGLKDLGNLKKLSICDKRSGIEAAVREIVTIRQDMEVRFNHTEL
jgi:hypothetical protein